MLHRRITRAAAAVAAASVIGVWSPQVGYELGFSSSNRAEAATPTVAPTGFKLDVGDGKLFPYWSANTDTGVTGYKVTCTWLGVVGGALGGTQTTTVNAPLTTATLSGLSNGTPYTVQVSALYADGSESAASAQLSATPSATSAPLQPTGLAATVADGKVPLTWNVPADTNRKRVDVYRDGALLTQIAAGAAATTMSYTDTAVTNARTYSYRVIAVNSTATPVSRSSYSTAVTGAPVDSTPPAVPTGLTASSTDKAVNLTWNANTDGDFDHYVLNGGTANNVSLVGTSYAATGLANGTNYTFTLSAVDRVGNRSATTSVTARPVDDVAPDVPTGLAVTPADSALALTWNASAASDTAGYKVYLNGVQATTVPAGTTSTRVGGLVNGTSYRVQISAVDGIPNESARSASVYGTPADLTPPSAPTGFTGTAGDGQATFTWNGSPEADVNRYVVRNASGTAVATVGANSRTATVTGLVNGTPATFTVVAIDTAGNVSASSAVASVTPRDTTPPSAPTNLNGTAGDTQVSLTWTRSPEPDTDHYVVRNGAGTTLATVTGNAAAITGLTNDTAVTFTVVGVDTAGNVSGSSNAISLTPRDTTPPSAPSNLVATAGENRATLSWGGSPEPDVVKYLVKDASGTTVATVPVGTTSTTITGLTNDTSFTYTVVAVDRSGNVSAPSNPATVTPKDLTPPSAPTNLTAVAGDTRATLLWTRSPEPDVDHYSVTTAAGTVVATVGGTTSTATIAGLVDGTAYTYVVVAVDTSGNVSAGSAPVTVVPVDTTPPSIPANFQATAGDGTAAVRWTASPEPDVHHYVVRNSTGDTLATVPAGTTDAVLTGLRNNSAVTLSVVAVDTVGNVSAASNSVTVTPRDTTAPSAPTNLAASAGDTTATLTWTPSPEPDVDHYLVKASDGSTVTTVTGTSATLTRLTDGTAYTFTVVAVDTSGNVSPASGAVSVTPVDKTPPAAPAGVGSSAGSGTVIVTWAASSDPDVDHYEVVDQTGTTRASAPAGSTSVTVGGLTDGTAYSFSVVAVDAAGNRSPAAPAPAATPRAPLAAPQAVAASGGDTRVTVTWSPVGDARLDHYSVCAVGGPCWSVPTGTTSYTVTGLTNGTSYGYVVRSVDVSGAQSPDSATATATPQAAPPAAPQNVVGTAGDGSASVSWQPVDGAVGYDVLTDGGNAQRVTATSATIANLRNGTSYTFTVRAVSATGTAGAVSAPVSLTPRAPLSTTTPTTGAGAGGAVVSRDGKVSVFGTSAQLEPSDTNSTYELYVKDAATGSVSRLAPSLENSDLAKSQLALSANGRYLAVVTSASMSPQDTNTLPDAYRVDLQSGAWTLVSAPQGGTSSASVAGASVGTGLRVYSTTPSLAISADGSKVFFFSDRTDLVAGDTNQASDLFVKDLGTGAVTRVSTTATGGQLSAGVQGPALAVTPDGRFVVFAAKPSNVTVAWRKDLQTGALDVVSGVGTWQNLTRGFATNWDSHEVAISDDGRFVAFTSDSTVLTSGAGDFLAYRKDMTAGSVTRAGLPNQTRAWEHQVALDPTGQYLFFETKADYGADSDGHVDWYRRDVTGTATVQVTSTSTGAPSAAPMTGASTNAEFGSLCVLSADQVVVVTMQALVPADVNKVSDVYGKTLSTGAVGSTV